MDLIDQLIQNGYLKTPAIIKAFRQIRRRGFVGAPNLELAEADEALTIGRGQTISQPATVAFMLEKLEPRLGDKILDVGAGSGWTAALLARIAGDKGKVFGLERILELADFARANADKYDFIKSGRVRIFCSDGFKGLPESAPFDKILVSAAAEEIPAELLKELKTGGRLVMPVGRQFETQSIAVVEKIAENDFKQKDFPGFIFVPLIKN